MQTQVIYTYRGNLEQIRDMRQYVESLGLKPKLVVDHLELTLLGESCGPLEVIGWRIKQYSLTTVPAILTSTVRQKPVLAFPKKVVRTTEEKLAAQEARKKKRIQDSLLRDISRWKKAEQSVVDESPAEPIKPLANPLGVSASLVREINEHNRSIPVKSKKPGIWRQGTNYNITLRTKRPYRIRLDCVCSCCREWTNKVYRYKETSHGVVYLCERCNEITRERSFGSRGGDAMYAAYGRSRAR